MWGKPVLENDTLESGFSKNYLPTMGADFAIKKFDKKSLEVEMQIWDIARLIGFRRLIPRFMKNARGVFFVFDLTVKKSFKNITKWIQKYKDVNKDMINETPIYLY